MTRPPLATAISSLLGVLAPVSVLLPLSPVFAGGSGERVYRTSYSTVEQNEIGRRVEETERGRAAIEAGDRAMKEKDYEKAFAQYKLACDMIPNATNTARLYSRALRGLTDAGIALAEQRIAEGRYADAENVLKVVLDEHYNPDSKRAKELLANLETPDYFNKTIGPQFRARVEQVKQYFVEAKGYLESGRYDLAFKRCEQILALDPYNTAARKLEEQIDRKRDDYAVQAYDETRARMTWQVTHGWEMPCPAFRPEEQRDGGE